MRRIVPKPRPEGIRWLRSDGKPNFSDRLRRREGDAKIVARRPPRWVSKNSTVLLASEEMTRNNIRSLIVAEPATLKLEGLVTAMDIVNYLGGGELYDIVEKRHNKSLYAALVKERVYSVMNPNPIYAYTTEKLTDIVEKMIVNNVGVIPVVFPDDNSVWGVITEHDIVRELVEKKIGKTVEEVMTRNVVYVDSKAKLIDALKNMVKYGVRRLPIVDNEDKTLWGMITAKDVVRFIGSHEVFFHAERGIIDEIHEVPVKLVGTPGVATISPDADVGDAATLMSQKNTSSLIVVEDGEMKGIITERDVLYALALG